MKLSAFVAIAAVIGGSFLIPVPAQAQQLEIVTDLEEKYIVKDSAVGVTSISTKEFTSSEIDQVDSTSYYRQDSDRNILSRSPKNLYTVVRFRAIFVDLNGQKKPTNYFNVACLNPGLTEEAKNTLDYYTGMIQFSGQPKLQYRLSVPDVNSLSAVEEMKAKVCRRYAEF